MNKVIVELGAEADIRCAMAWFEERRPGLGQQFHDALEQMFDRILEFPSMTPEVRPGVRRAFNNRFRFKVAYSLDGGNVHILAVVHASRSPDAWTRQLAE